jgi:hypothetical protein
LRAGFLAGVIQPAWADIIVRGDGALLDGKVNSTDEKQITFLPDGADASQTQRLERSFVTRVVHTDEHGARIPDGPATQPSQDWTVPPEPVAPPMASSASAKPTYCLIPLHGEVGSTILASALEKSLADAVKRKPVHRAPASLSATAASSSAPAAAGG